MNRITEIVYAIWHTPRTGSNMLCSILSQLDDCGIADYENCGFFVGWDIKSDQDFIIKSLEYLEKQTTGRVSGTKLSVEYFFDLIQQKKISRKAVRDVLQMFTHHIDLSRENRIAQAVSFVIAERTKLFSSRADHPGKELGEYDFDSILHAYARIERLQVANSTYRDLLGLRTYPITYEGLISDRGFELAMIGQHLGKPITPHVVPSPLIQKQANTINEQWIAAFKADIAINRGGV